MPILEAPGVIEGYKIPYAKKEYELNSTNKDNHITHAAVEQILHLHGFFGAGLSFFELSDRPEY